MIHYILQTIAFQLLFLLIYDLFLKRETFFNWNRLYLVGTMFLSLLLPFVQLESFKEVIPQEYVIQLPAVVIGDLSNTATEGVNQVNAAEVSTSMWYVYLLFYIGFVIAVFAFLYKLFKILKLVLNNPKTSSNKLVIVKLLNSNSAFSFFKYVFLGEFLKEEEKALILSHEMVHVKQYHSLDLLFFEMLRIVFWFNPMVYMYQNRTTELHEFLADAEAVKYQSKQHYYQNLLAQVFQTKSISFINPFFNQSLIKKRIIMLQKSKSKHIKCLKYAFLIPAVIAMLVYTSCDKQSENSSDGLNLSDYTFSVNVAEGFNEATLNKRSEYDNFLFSNPEYVAWVLLEKGKTTYSIHKKEEKLPEGYVLGSHKVSKEGKVYKIFMNSESVQGLMIMESGASPNIEVPFAHVEHVPVFPGCESLETNEERKNCMSQAISKFVNENFNTDLANSLELQGRQRINVEFKISEEGNVIDVRARASHPVLEAEAERVINLLPKMQPGKQKGKIVTVPYSLPIVFQVADKK